ncbi:SKP1-like protein 14 [Castanea sativa]|uniref:SKP1-like protein 14 n=1 Tax=Castanea sativa TaxID=21020 RepID=UPI003F6543A5
MVTFRSSDGEEVQVPVAIATEIGIVSKYYDGELNRPEVENADLFPLPNVKSHVLRFILDLLRAKLEFDSEFEALKTTVKEVKAEFFGLQTDDETVVELVKAADYMRIEKLLDFMMPCVRKRFGLGDDKDADFVYTAEFETILLRRAASGSVGTG